MEDIKVNLFAPMFKTGQAEEYRISEHTTIGQFIGKVGFHSSGILLILINGRPSKIDKELKDGDTLGIFPLLDGG